MSLVRFQDVHTSLGSVEVHRGLSFQVERGQVVCLLGPSGCGKTTALRIMAGLLRRYQGQVEVDGLPPERAWPRLALVFQSPRLAFWRTALENVLLGLELRSVPLGKRERLEQAHRWLATMGLEAETTKYPWTLSGGERHRLALARALALDPDLLLMDEAFSDQDLASRQRLWQQTLDLCGQTGKTVVLVTHDVEEALYLANRIYVLSRKPSAVTAALEVTLPHPRDPQRSDGTLQGLRTALHAALQASPVPEAQER